ncbi:MAG: alpha-amylase family glycosyl hydrolase, partial [Xanthomonadaceae bacterium]|nr:alpha-amylase family glycosyl hydrolase [Xanthomonadaceae bacterium]
DRGGYPDDRDLSGFDPARKGYFHGGDLKGLLGKLDYIQGMGVTAIWLAPIFANKPVQGPPGQLSAGYHGYWITDFTRVDPHFGSNADFKALVDAAHARGMKVIMDIVINHSADVIDYRECAPVAEGGVASARSDCPYRNKAMYPYTRRGGRNGVPINVGFAGDTPAQQTAENFAHLTDPDYAYTPFVRAAEAHVKVPDWLNDPIYYHNRGNSLWKGESALGGDFAGLDDLFTEHPRVLAGMIDIYKDWITRYRVDGFRIDTAKHVDDAFWQRFIPAILAHAKAEGIPNFYLFGEAYALTPKDLSRFTREAAFPAVLDFAFQQAAMHTVAEGAPTRRLKKLFDADRLYADGVAGAARLPTFLGNHDMGRFGFFLQQSQEKHADAAGMLKRAMLGHALLLLARGVPVIYYGDEQGFTGDGGDQDSREDMFPSRVVSYNDNRLIGSSTTTADDNFDPAHPLYRELAALAALRNAHPALRGGEQVVRYSESRAGLFAFSRIDRASGEELLVVLNTASVAREHTLPVAHGERAWRKLIGEGSDTLTPLHAKVRVQMPPLSYTVYRADIPVAPR